MSSKKTLITSDNPKGRKFVELCRAAYDKAGLDETQAQRLNERGGELKYGIERLIAQLSHVWLIWRALTIGGKDVKQLLADLASAGRTVSDWAQDIMGKSAFTTLESPQELALVRVRVRDLGFSNPNQLPTTTQVFARAKELGLELCPAEVGPHLAIQFTDQSVDETVWVAMEPIADSNGDLSVFCVNRGEDKRWLSSSYANPGIQWNLEGEIVFMLSK